MATREIKAYERVQGWLVPFLAVSKKLLPRAILMRKPESKNPPRGPNPAPLAGASTGPDYKRLTFPQICDIKINQHIQTS
jgi:hypothetical protein